MPRANPKNQSQPRDPGRRWAAWSLLAASVVAVCWPLLSHGPLPMGSDVLATTHYLQGFMKAFGEGDLYPRWTDPSIGELGAPSFVLFPPLTYYGAAAMSWLAGSIIVGLKLYLCVILALSAASFYRLALEWIGDPIASACGSALYLLLPYHVLDVYQRFALSEAGAFV